VRRARRITRDACSQVDSYARLKRALPWGHLRAAGAAPPLRSTALEARATHEATPLSRPSAVFVLGGPGSGKGTQCGKLVERCSTAPAPGAVLLAGPSRARGRDALTELVRCIAVTEPLGCRAVTEPLRPAGTRRSTSARGICFERRRPRGRPRPRSSTRAAPNRPPLHRIYTENLRRVDEI